MNYATFIVKIREERFQTIYNNEISSIKFLVELPNTTNDKPETLINVHFWGNFSEEISQHFFIGDFLIVEGYLIFKTTSGQKKDKQIELTAFKLYPFIL